MVTQTQTDALRAVERVEKVLPVPPSTNVLFATVRTPKGGLRRIPTREYKGWREEAGQLGKPWPRYSESTSNQIPWTLHLTLWNLPRNRDLSNTVKAVEDLIVEHTGLRDNWVDDIALARRWDDGEARVLVRLEVREAA